MDYACNWIYVSRPHNHCQFYSQVKTEASPIAICFPGVHYAFTGTSVSFHSDGYLFLLLGGICALQFHYTRSTALWNVSKLSWIFIGHPQRNKVSFRFIALCPPATLQLIQWF